MATNARRNFVALESSGCRPHGCSPRGRRKSSTPGTPFEGRLSGAMLRHGTKDPQVLLRAALLRGELDLVAHEAGEAQQHEHADHDPGGVELEAAHAELGAGRIRVE